MISGNSVARLVPAEPRQTPLSVSAEDNGLLSQTQAPHYLMSSVLEGEQPEKRRAAKTSVIYRPDNEPLAAEEKAGCLSHCLGEEESSKTHHPGNQRGRVRAG